jgi:hypothetical protein
MRAEQALPEVGVIQGNYPGEPRRHLVQLGFMKYYTPEQIYEICAQALEAASEAAKKNRLADEEKAAETGPDVYHDIYMNDQTDAVSVQPPGHGAFSDVWARARERNRT